MPQTKTGNKEEDNNSDLEIGVIEIQPKNRKKVEKKGP